MVNPGAGGRGGVPVRLRVAVAGFKAAGALKPLLAAGLCRGWPGLPGGLCSVLLRLGYFAGVPAMVSPGPDGRCGARAWLRLAAPGVKAAGAFPPLLGSLRLRRRRHSVRLRGPLPGRGQVARLPGATSVRVSVCGPRRASRVPRFRLWCGRLPQCLTGFKATGTLKPLRGFPGLCRC